MLCYIQNFYDVHQWEGVSTEEMQNIFSNSSIVLNENLFSGFTLRILQGMAAGSLVLTEANMDGVDKYFHDGTHLVCYEHHNLLDKIKDILDRPQYYKKIAIQGQELCRAQHVSHIRAGELLSAIEDKTNINVPKHGEEALFHEAMYRYNVIRRVGGIFTDSVQIFKKLSQGNSLVASKASCVLGDIFSRMNKKEDAQHYYMYALTQCCDKNDEALIYCRLAIFALANSEIMRASTFVQNAVEILLPCDAILREKISSYSSLLTRPVLLFWIANLYEILGIDIHMGFSKQEEEFHPETAIEIALMAWRECNDTNMLDFLLEKLKQYNMAGEILSQLSHAVFKGSVTQKQFLSIVEISESYYDKDLAYKMLCAYKNNRQ